MSSRVLTLKTWSAALIVAGTAIGAGMLMLPIVTAQAGFIPSWVLYLSCAILAIISGFYFVEISSWLENKANLVSMARHFLGPFGAFISWVLYLFLFYSLTIAYLAGGARIVGLAFGAQLDFWLLALIFTVVLGSIVYAGTKVVGRFNAVFMVALIVAYLLFIGSGVTQAHKINLELNNWFVAGLALPVIFTSFSYQGTIPTLMTYLGRDKRKMRAAIFLGVLITFLVYLVWDLVIKSVIPVYGEHSLTEVRRLHKSVVEPLSYILKSQWIVALGSFFAFFSIVTTFLGVTLPLMDFYADSLHVANRGSNKIYIWLLVFVPPLIVVCIDPHVFEQALRVAGGFGCATLLYFFPALMIWSGRYKHNLKTELPFLTSRLVLLIMVLLVIIEVAISAYSLGQS